MISPRSPCASDSRCSRRSRCTCSSSLPDGRLTSRARQRSVVAGYVVGLVVGGVLCTDLDTIATWPIVALWIAALAAGIYAASLRYRVAGAVERRRMQWIGWGITVAAEGVLVMIALRLLTDWPHDPGTVALAMTGLVPIAIIAGTQPKMVARVDILLTHTVALAGLTALILGIYVIVVLGLGRTPDGSERTLLLLSMVAAAIAALLYLPARRWLTERANRLVYGVRVAPDETLRTFGQRLTRSIPLDELMLQLAENLRSSMVLASAEVWTGQDGRYEQMAGVPHRQPPPITIGPKELPVVARAGVSGGTWLDIWVPQLVGPSGSSRHARRPRRALRPAARLHRREPQARRRTVHRNRGHRPHRDRPPDRAGVAQRPARHRTAGEPRRAADPQPGTPGLPGPHRRRRRQRAAQVGAQPARRRPTAPRGARGEAASRARCRRGRRPADAIVMIDEIKGDVQTAIAELRALAHGIFPPLLVSGGLNDALPAAAGRAALPTTVDLVDVGRYGNDIEAAVYFCTLEALQNAGKHAGENATAAVTVVEADGVLRFEIRDDGAGFDMANGSPGRPRLREHGRTVSAHSAAGWRSCPPSAKAPPSPAPSPSPNKWGLDTNRYRSGPVGVAAGLPEAAEHAGRQFVFVDIGDRAARAGARGRSSRPYVDTRITLIAGLSP